MGIYLIVHIYNQLDAEQRAALFAAIKGANYFWVGLSFAMGLLSHYIRGYRWKFQLVAMGYTTKGSNNFMAVMTGYVINLALPRVGEVSRAAAITKYGGVPFQKSFGSILSERALDFIILLIITSVTLILQYAVLESFADDLLGKFGETASSPLLWSILIAGVLGGLIGIRLLKRNRHIPFVGKFWSLVEGLMEGLRSIVRMKQRGAYLLATLAIWALYVGMFWVCFLSLEETAGLGINAISAGFVIGSFAVALIPGGIGAFPVGIMQVLMLYGIAAETGFALGWIIWLSQTSMIVLVGGICMLLMPILNKPERNRVITEKNYIEDSI